MSAEPEAVLMPEQFESQASGECDRCLVPVSRSPLREQARADGFIESDTGSGGAVPVAAM